MLAVPPGTYLARRRRARGLTIDTLALQLESEPTVSHASRMEAIAAIEAGISPVTTSYANAIHRAVRFDRAVLERLIDLATGANLPHPRLCRHCCCSEHDACIEKDRLGCTWLASDLCSSCADADPADAIALPIPAPAAPIGAAA